jgi:hypothetical protein
MTHVTRNLREALDTIDYEITRDLTQLITLQTSSEGYVVRTYEADCHACRIRRQADSQIRLREDCVLLPTSGDRVHAHPACYDFMGHGPDLARYSDGAALRAHSTDRGSSAGTVLGANVRPTHPDELV